MPVGRCSSKLSGHELQAKSKKSQPLSGAPRGSIPYQTAYGAESKDPGDACWQMLFQAFQPRTTSQIKKVTSSERSASQIHLGGIVELFGSESPQRGYD